MRDDTLISFDYAIKFLLKDKSGYEIVEGFISAILGSKGYPPVKIKALLDPESNREVMEAKRSIADVIVEDQAGAKYIVEIDKSYSSLFLHKACFNGSRLIVDSVSEGEDYSNISKIIHINLLYFPFGPQKTPMYHGKTIFHKIDHHHPKKIHLENIQSEAFDAYDVFPEYFIISVPLFNDVIKSEMDEWLYLMKYSKVKKGFKSPYMTKVAKRLSLLTMTPTQRSKYLDYRNLTLKERDYVVSAEEKGLAKGIQKGIEQGIEKGIEKGKIEVARNLLKAGVAIEVVTQSTGLKKDEIEKLKSS